MDPQESDRQYRHFLCKLEDILVPKGAFNLCSFSSTHRDSQAGLCQLENTTNMSAYLFQRFLPPGVFSNNPVFSTMVRQPAPVAGLTALAIDLTGGKELVELTASKVVTTILHKLGLDGHRIYKVIKVSGLALFSLQGFTNSLSASPSSQTL